MKPVLQSRLVAAGAFAAFAPLLVLTPYWLDAARSLTSGYGSYAGMYVMGTSRVVAAMLACLAFVAAVPVAVRNLEGWWRIRARRRPAPEARDPGKPHPSISTWIECPSGNPGDGDTVHMELMMQTHKPVEEDIRTPLLEALTSPSDLVSERLATIAKTFEAKKPDTKQLGVLAAEWGRGNPPALKTFAAGYPYEAPMLLRAWMEARRRVSLVPSDVLFLKQVDERMWYAIQNVGRPAWYAKGAGVIDCCLTLERDPAIMDDSMALYVLVDRARASIEAARPRGDAP
jgi:hypothetical protein